MKTTTQSEKSAKAIANIFTVAMVIGFALFVYKTVLILQANGILPR